MSASPARARSTDAGNSATTRSGELDIHARPSAFARARTRPAPPRRVWSRTRARPGACFVAASLNTRSSLSRGSPEDSRCGVAPPASAAARTVTDATSEGFLLQVIMLAQRRNGRARHDEFAFRHVFEGSAVAAPFPCARCRAAYRNRDTTGIRCSVITHGGGRVHGLARECTLGVFQAGSKDGNDRRSAGGSPPTSAAARVHGWRRWSKNKAMPLDADNLVTARLLRFAVAMTFRVDSARSAVPDRDICTNGGMNGS
jgi:hypothetical protein